jgi:hypothetical protein
MPPAEETDHELADIATQTPTFKLAVCGKTQFLCEALP